MARTLQLVNLDKFSRTGLNLPTGVPVILSRGEYFRVEDGVADQLLADENCNFDGDDNPQPWFVAVEDETVAVAYDFTLPPVEKVEYGTPEGSVEHSFEVLDGVAQEDLKQKATRAVGIKRASQRTKASA